MNNGERRNRLDLESQEEEKAIRKVRRAAKSYLTPPSEKPPAKSKKIKKTKNHRSSKTKKKTPILKSKEGVQTTVNVTQKVVKPFIDYDELPQSYCTTQVTLIPRDPYCVYVYWEIDSSVIEELRRQLGADLETATYTLRVYDVTYIDFNGYSNHKKCFCG